MLKNVAVNKISRILREVMDARCAEEKKTCRKVATEILATIPLKPDSIWLCQTDIENTGRHETAWSTEADAYEYAADVLEKWLDEFDYSNRKDWSVYRQRIEDALLDQKIETAIETWNNYQGTSTGLGDAELYVFPLSLD